MGIKKRIPNFIPVTIIYPIPRTYRVYLGDNSIPLVLREVVAMQRIESHFDIPHPYPILGKPGVYTLVGHDIV